MILWGQVAASGYSAGSLFLMATLVVAALLDAFLTSVTTMYPALEVDHGVVLFSTVLVCEAVVIINTSITMRVYVGQVKTVEDLGGELPFLITSGVFSLVAFLTNMWSLQRARADSRTHAVHPEPRTADAVVIETANLCICDAPKRTVSACA